MATSTNPSPSTSPKPEAAHQLSIYSNDYNDTEKQIQVNIWNYDPAWKTEYWVDGKSKGALEQFEGFDPKAYATLLGPDLPKPRGFAEPRMTDHLFKAIVPVKTKKIKVVATDRFGKKSLEGEVLMVDRDIFLMICFQMISHRIQAFFFLWEWIIQTVKCF